MKKNIEYIRVSSSIIEKMLKVLDQNSKDFDSKEDLVIGLSNLLNGMSSSLMIELNDSPSSVSADNQITAGDLTIFVHSHRVIRNGKDIALTPKEYDILYFLIRNQGQVFTKEQIYHAVWSADYLLDDSNIMSFIRKIRKKIEPTPDDPQYILTVWGIGYKFNDQL